MTLPTTRRGATRPSPGTRPSLHQRGDRPLRAALDDPHAARDLARVVLVLVEAVVVGLPRFGDAGIAQLDDAPGDAAGADAGPRSATAIA